MLLEIIIQFSNEPLDNDCDVCLVRVAYASVSSSSLRQLFRRLGVDDVELCLSSSGITTSK